MADANSTVTPIEQVKSNSEINTLGYFDFINTIGGQIFDIQALSNGAKALVETSEWETDTSLCSAFRLLNQISEGLERLAERVDASSSTYALKK